LQAAQFWYFYDQEVAIFCFLAPDLQFDFTIEWWYHGAIQFFGGEYS